MSETKLLPSGRILDLFNILNKENMPDAKAVAIREIDITSLERVREQLKANGKAATYTAFVAKAVAQTLREMPQANRSVGMGFLKKQIFQFTKEHVSVAVERNDAADMCGGAFVYTVYDTSTKSLSEISHEISGLADLTLESGDPRLERWERMTKGVRQAPFVWILRLVIWMHKNIPSFYVKNRGGAVMISSPSKYGVDFIVAHWPYTLGISFGLAKMRPWVIDGQLVARKTMAMTLAFDRRLIPGAQAAKFMNRMCVILENAEEHFQKELSDLSNESSTQNVKSIS